MLLHLAVARCGTTTRIHTEPLPDTADSGLRAFRATACCRRTLRHGFKPTRCRVAARACLGLIRNSRQRCYNAGTQVSVCRPPCPPTATVQDPDSACPPWRIRAKFPRRPWGGDGECRARACGGASGHDAKPLRRRKPCPCLGVLRPRRRSERGEIAAPLNALQAGEGVVLGWMFGHQSNRPIAAAMRLAVARSLLKEQRRCSAPRVPRTDLSTILDKSRTEPLPRAVSA